MMRRRPDNKQSSMSLRRWSEFAVFLAACFAFGSIFVFSSDANIEQETDIIGSSSVETVEESGQNFSKFQHSNPMHARLPCLICHKRDDNSSKPKYPGHFPCAGCHAQQFAAGNQHPICMICHTPTSVKRFPPLRSFNVKFTHARHTRQTNCATCHKPARRGVAFSIPSGANAHTTCFQCHTANSSNTMASCSLCHQLGRSGKISEWAKAFTFNFSHAAHGGKQKLNCASCHTVLASAGRGRQVTKPLASMHFSSQRTKSCATCHNEKRAFGEDFSDCRRCHTGKNFRF